MGITHFLSIQIFLWYTVDAYYYCEFGFCEPDTYCCGDNICCNNVHSIWYFWAGVIFVLIVLGSFFGFFKFCYTPQCVLDKLRSPYIKVPSNRKFQGQGVDLESGPSPPSYEEVTRLTSK